MKQWLNELLLSWKDRHFVCAILLFIMAYVLIAVLGLLVSHKIYGVIVTGIAGWQLASWCYRYSPKVCQWIFKQKKY